MLGTNHNPDRILQQPELEAVDAIMLTLDADKYLEATLDAFYREVPIKRLHVVDGGSKDSTLELLAQYPRVEVHERPDIRTTGKGFELLLSLTTTPWVVFVDVGKIPARGWYEEMLKYQDRYDFYGSTRIVHYEFELEDPRTTDPFHRPLGGPWVIRSEALKGFRVDDDYSWRIIDRVLRQVVEKNGYNYGGVKDTHHTCFISDNVKYASDQAKRASRLVFSKPQVEVLNPDNWEDRLEQARRGVIKYLDPEFCPDMQTDANLRNLLKLDLEWVLRTNPKWHRVLSAYKIKHDEEQRRHQQLHNRLYRATRQLLGSLRRDGVAFIETLKG